jgi:hypothetical protein
MPSALPLLDGAGSWEASEADRQALVGSLKAIYRRSLAVQTSDMRAFAAALFEMQEAYLEARRVARPAP